MRVVQALKLLFIIFNSLLLTICYATPSDCKPLYVEKPSNRNSQIDIREPGKYCLMIDLHARFDFADHPAEGRLIHIWSSNVELDLMGHTLGRGRLFVQKGGTGIQAYNVENVTIKNGILQDFDVGIYFARFNPPKPFYKRIPQLTGQGNWIDSAANIRIENIIFKNCKQNMLFYDWVDKPTTDMQSQMPAK